MRNKELAPEKVAEIIKFQRLPVQDIAERTGIKACIVQQQLKRHFHMKEAVQIGLLFAHRNKYHETKDDNTLTLEWIAKNAHMYQVIFNAFYSVDQHYFDAFVENMYYQKKK